MIAGHGLLASAIRTASARWCSASATPRTAPSTWSPPRSVALDSARLPASCATSRRARRSSSTASGKLHSAAVRRQPRAQPVHLRVRLPRAARLGDRRHLGLPGAPAAWARRSPSKILRERPHARHRRGHPDPRLEPPGGAAARAAARHASTAKASSRTATSAAPSSCRGRASARNRCARSSTRSASSSRARTCCWSTTRSCAAPPRSEIVQMAREAGAKQGLSSPRPRRRCASRTSTASTCRRRDELVAHGRSDRGDRARSSAPTR